MNKANTEHFNIAIAHIPYIEKRVNFYMSGYRPYPKELAEDITQEIVIKVAENYGSYSKTEASIQTWISVIIRNYIVSYFRMKKNNPNLMKDIDNHLDIEIDEFSTPEQHFFKNETISVFRKKIDELPEKQKEAISLLLNDLSYQEISERMNVSLSSVKSLIFRAKEKLKDELQTYVA